MVQGDAEVGATTQRASLNLCSNHLLGARASAAPSPPRSAPLQTRDLGEEPSEERDGGVLGEWEQRERGRWQKKQRCTRFTSQRGAQGHIRGGAVFNFRHASQEKAQKATTEEERAACQRHHKVIHKKVDRLSDTFEDIYFCV